MATLKDVAERAGVTVTTVSRMLNNRVRVSEKTRCRILDAMKDLDYQPNELAQSLTKKRSNFIGLIVPSARNFFFAQVIEHTERFAVAKGFKLLLCVSNLEMDKELEYFGMLRANKVAGVILASHTQELQDHLNFEAPIVTIDRTISPLIPSLCPDNYHGGELAAAHLLGSGCKKLAYFSGSSGLDMDANKRYLGFRDFCQKKRAACPLFVDACEESFISMDYETLIRDLFASHPDTDGIFTSNDIIAAQLVQYLSARGKRIPEDIRIIGYDDTDLASLCTPPLTTIHQPIEDICRTAVDYIYSSSHHTQMEEPTFPEGTPRTIVFPVTLIKRGSA